MCALERPKNVSGLMNENAEASQAKNSLFRSPLLAGNCNAGNEVFKKCDGLCMREMLILCSIYVKIDNAVLYKK